MNDLLIVTMLTQSLRNQYVLLEAMENAHPIAALAASVAKEEDKTKQALAMLGQKW